MERGMTSECENEAVQVEAKTTEELKSEAITIAIGFSLGITALAYYATPSAIAMFGALLAYLIGRKGLSIREKVPALGLVVAGALVATVLLDSGGGMAGSGDSYYSNSSGGAHLIGNKDCTYYSDAGVSMQVCD